MNQNKHKILLIEPPFNRLFKYTYSLDRYPLSLGYLAGTIKKETDWDVKVYNADFYPKSEWIKVSYLTGLGFENYLANMKDLSARIWGDVKSTILKYKPTVVGISAKSQNFVSACMVAKLAKEINEQIIVIVGGPHPSMVGADVLNCKDIDVAVRGEGEDTIVELLRAIDVGTGFGGIQGALHRRGNEIFENDPREFIKDLDLLCFPHESAPEVLIDYDKYPLSAFRYIFATRGCPGNCLFCGSKNVWSRKPRFRSPENVICQIKGLQRMGIKIVHFDDDTFGITKKYINALCNALIAHCPGLTWSCELHVRLVDEPTISLMEAAGCFKIQIGIESGNNKILEEMKKGITIEKALAACELIKKRGIQVHAFFIVGFPQETEETLSDTVAAMRKIECHTLVYSIFTPYPGTQIFEFCKRNGLINDDYNVALYNHQSPTNCFCMYLSPERFRELVSNIEKMVDRKNSLDRIKRVVSLNTLRKIQELGIAKSVQKGVNMLTGR